MGFRIEESLSSVSHTPASSSFLAPSMCTLQKPAPLSISSRRARNRIVTTVVLFRDITGSDRAAESCRKDLCLRTRYWFKRSDWGMLTAEAGLVGNVMSLAGYIRCARPSRKEYSGDPVALCEQWQAATARIALTSAGEEPIMEMAWLYGLFVRLTRNIAGLTRCWSDELRSAPTT